MKFTEITSGSLRAAFAVAIAAVCPVSGVAQEAGSAESVETRELRAALSVSREQVEELTKQAEATEAQRKALVESLAEAVRVSEEQVAATREMQLKLQAFGVDLFAQDEDNLQQRLLKAVRDLDISQQENERQAKALHQVSEAFLKYLQATADAPEAERAEAEKAIADAGKVLRPIEEETAVVAEDISAARVVSIESAIGLVVFNAGRASGLRVGTPVAILRDDRPIFTAMIVDVRDSISGAVLQDRMADTGDVAVGDAIRLLPHQRNL